MENTPGGPSPLLLAVYRMLLALAAVLIAVIVAGTAVGLKPRQAAAKGDSAEAGVTKTGTAYFTGIGRIRAAAAGSHPATVVVSIAFPYDQGDAAFHEELAAKTKDFRDTATAYFSSLTASQLRELPEEDIKQELRKRFNDSLLLGKIPVLFFNDFLVID